MKDYERVLIFQGKLIEVVCFLTIENLSWIFNFLLFILKRLSKAFHVT